MLPRFCRARYRNPRWLVCQSSAFCRISGIAPLLSNFRLVCLVKTSLTATGTSSVAAPYQIVMYSEIHFSPPLYLLWGGQGSDVYRQTTGPYFLMVCGVPYMVLRALSCARSKAINRDTSNVHDGPLLWVFRSPLSLWSQLADFLIKWGRLQEKNGLTFHGLMGLLYRGYSRREAI
jgi:hypothetical protein